MDNLVNAVATLGRPYSITRSRLGAITKVYSERFICDVPAIKELILSLSEKLRSVPGIKESEFSLLVSYSDQTHHDFGTAEIESFSKIATGKITERVVVRWTIRHRIDDTPNELSLTVRIANPINPLVVLQAALSRSAADLDNFEFEMGSTCATVDGAGQNFADEVFLRIKTWIDARSKPHSFLPLLPFYKKHEWLIDQLSVSFFPLIVVALSAFALSRQSDLSMQMTYMPLIFAAFLIFARFGHHLNVKMVEWAHKTRTANLFDLTNGDSDALTKQIAAANKSALKLIGSTLFAFAINVLAGIACWWFLPPQLLN